MNDKDIELAGEVVKAAADSALEPFKEAVTNIVGPFTKEAGLLLAVPFQWWRFKATLAIMEMARAELRLRGIGPAQVPFKVLVPLLEGASLEEDSEMQSRWATLLANVADPTCKIVVLPAFIEILKSLTPTEASIISAAAKYQLAQRGAGYRQNLQWPIRTEKILADKQLTIEDQAIAFANFHRLSLIAIRTTMLQKDFDTVVEFSFTHFGWAFVKACEPNTNRKG